MSDNSTNDNTSSKTGAIEASRKVLAAAKEQAAAIVEEARKHVDSELINAKKRATENASEEIASNLLKIERERANILEQAKDEIVSMVLAISEEVIGESLKVQPESIVARIKRAVAYACSSRSIRLIINPQDEPFVKEHLNEISKLATSCQSLVLQTDLNIKLGEARLETDIAVVRSSISEHINRIKEHFQHLTKI